MSFRRFLEGRKPTRPELDVYLQSTIEWARTEFKLAKKVPEFGLRKAICAQANGDGGDVFLGVEDDGTVRGVRFDLDEVAKVLDTNPSTESPRFETSLRRYLPNPIIAIEVEPDLNVLVLEVVPNGVPCLILDENGRFQMYERKLRSSEPMDARAVVERFLKMGRAKMLREIYVELQQSVKQVHLSMENHPPPGVLLPRFERMYAEGVWSEFALKVGTRADDWALFQSNYLGAAREFPETWKRTYDAYWKTNRTEFGNTIRQHRENLLMSVGYVRRYLQDTGVAIPE